MNLSKLTISASQSKESSDQIPLAAVRNSGFTEPHRWLGGKRWLTGKHHLLGKHWPGKRRWLGKKISSLVGIDIDVDEVRVVTLQPLDHSEDCFGWRSLYRYPLPKFPRGETTSQWLQETVQAIETKLPRCIEGDRHVAAISLPISWSHYQTTTGHELHDTANRCSEMFRRSVFQSPAQLSHWPVVGTHHGHPSADDQYVVAAAAERIACELCDCISQSGFDVRSILPNAVSLAHAAQPLTGLKAQMIVWLSKSASLVAVMHQSGIGLTRVFGAVPDGILATEQSGRPLDCHALRPFLSTIAEELQATAKFAARADMNRPSDLPILVCGPLAEINGVEKALATLSQKPVAVWRYSGSTRPTPTTGQRDAQPADFGRSDASFANALSLAWAAGRTSARGYCE